VQSDAVFGEQHHSRDTCLRLRLFRRRYPAVKRCPTDTQRVGQLGAVDTLVASEKQALVRISSGDTYAARGARFQNAVARIPRAQMASAI
jgi:hypothetical protein